MGFAKRSPYEVEGFLLSLNGVPGRLSGHETSFDGLVAGAGRTFHVIGF